MASPEMEALAAAMAQMQPGLLTSTIDEQRAAWETVGTLHPVRPGTEVRSAWLGGVPVEEVVAPGVERGRVVVHLHGGGYVIGSPTTHRSFASRLSAAAGCPVVVPGYRLAPEHRFPAALHDAAAVLGALIEHMGDAEAVALSGDSAGGGLAVATVVEHSARGGPAPGALVCWSPWVDLSMEAVSGPEPADDPVLSVEWLERQAENYLGGTPPSDPRASPLRGPLGGLPPTLALVGTRELLGPQTAELAEKAAEAGVAVELEEVPGAIHLWMVWVPDAPESRAALERAGEFLRSHLGR